MSSIFVDHSLKEVICDFPYKGVQTPNDLVSWIHAPNKAEEAKIFATSVHLYCPHVFSGPTLEQTKTALLCEQKNGRLHAEFLVGSSTRCAVGYSPEASEFCLGTDSDKKEWLNKTNVDGHPSLHVFCADDIQVLDKERGRPALVGAVAFLALRVMAEDWHVMHPGSMRLRFFLPFRFSFIAPSPTPANCATLLAWTKPNPVGSIALQVCSHEKHPLGGSDQL